MRTKDEILNFLISLGISSRDFEEYRTYAPWVSFSIMLTGRADHKRITDYGLFVGYGDAFDYRGDGVVAIGDPEVGKSSLAKKFHAETGAGILSEDDLLLLDPDGKGAFRIYKDPFAEQISLAYQLPWEKILDRYAQSLAGGQGVPLRTILHLKYSPREGFVEPDTNEVLSVYLASEGTLYVPENSALPPMLDGVHILAYETGCESKRRYTANHLERQFQAVRSRLNELHC